MKTVLEIVKEKIARTAALAGDMPAMIAQAQKAEARMLERMASDPSLSIFVTHYADALAEAIKGTPDVLHPFIVKSMLMQVITEWEDVHAEYSKQLTPTP